MVGDAEWDLLAAGRAGMLGIGVLSGGSPRSTLLECNPFRIYRDSKELGESLEELGLVR